MMSRVSIKNILSILLLSAVYSSFFIVQFFFNFEIVRNNGNIYSYTSEKNHFEVKGRLAATAKTKEQSSQKNKFHLNKRFQPGNNSFCGCINTSIPVLIFIKKKYSLLDSVFLQPLFYNILSLRGPPQF
jgi:hypothetical protein